MDPQIVSLLLALIALAGTYITVKYKDYWKNRPKKKTTLELFFERYEEDIKALKADVKEAKEQAEEALKLVREKDEEINKLQRQISLERAKYTRLLRRFNILKAKVDKQAKR